MERFQLMTTIKSLFARAILLLMLSLSFAYAQIDAATFASDEAPEIFIKAVKNNNLDVVNDMLTRGFPANVAVDNQPALLAAVQKGHVNMAKLLLNNGAYINTIDSDGNTALHIASRKNNQEMVQLLKNYTPDVNIKNAKNQKPIDIALKNKNIETASLIDNRAVKSIYNKTNFPAKASAGGGSNKTLLTVLGVAAAAGGVAAAAGGGGGGGGGGNNNSNVASNPSAIERTYLPYTQNLNQIGANTAYAQNLTGQGIKIAVIDDGFDITHPSLQGQIDLANSKNFVANNNNLNSVKSGLYDGHGTMVASIAAGKKIDNSTTHGVAYNAQIIGYKVTDDTDNGKFDRNLNRNANALNLSLKAAADQGADIINNSWGTQYSGISNPSDVQTEIEYATTTTNKVKGSIVVFAAGNASAEETPVPNPTNEGLAPKYARNDAAVQSRFLVVVAVDKDNKITDYSYRCGDAANWCLAAPGNNATVALDKNISAANRSDLLETRKLSADGNFITFPTNDGGTSFAAPYVSGSLALLMEQGLSNDAAVARLLSTATDLGKAGPDAIYGHGVINLNAALAKQGSLSVKVGNNVSGPSFSVENTKINLSPAFGDAIRQANIVFAGFDDLNRAYPLAMNVMSGKTEPLINSNIDRFSNNFTLNRQIQGENFTLAFSDAGLLGNQENIMNDNNVNPVYFSSTTKNSKIAFYHEINPNNFMGINQNDSQLDNVGQSFLAPYFTDMDKATVFTADYNLLPKINYKITNFSGSKSNSDDYNASGFLSEVSYKQDNNYGLQLQLGFKEEKNGVLGSKTKGAFAVDKDTPTYFSGVGGFYQINDNLQLFAAYYKGVTKVNAADYSLINNFSAIKSNSYNIGVTRHNLLQKDDQISFSFSQPLRVYEGKAQFDLAMLRDRQGNIYYSKQDVDLQAKGTEHNMEAFYSSKLDADTDMAASLLYRTEPNNIKTNKDEAIAMIKISKKF